MSDTQHNFQDTVYNYLPATLRHTAHGWTIEYSVINPTTNAMQRKVTKMNRIRARFVKISDFKAHCNGIICGLNARLAGGWTPFGEQQNTRLFTPLETVLDEYLREKSKELRPDTIVNYRSFCKYMKEWMESVCPNAQCGLFNKVLAVRFMDYVQNDRGLTGRSYNNKLKQARSFFSWAVEKCYAKENPFATLRPKREATKQRILIPECARRNIAAYFAEREPNYVVLCQLVFSALVRPKEAWRLKVADLHLSEGYLFVAADNAKTHYPRTAALTPDLRSSLARMTATARPDDFLFGAGYKPGKKQIVYSRFRKEWDTMRTALKLPKEMQLYSLRDTGINEMLKSGIDPLTVMQHADHHDLAMTTRYANHADPDLINKVYQSAPEF